MTRPDGYLIPKCQESHHTGTIVEKPGIGVAVDGWWRITCSCGWGTCWFLTIPLAEWSRHKNAPRHCRNGGS